MSDRIAILITDVAEKPIDIGKQGLQKLTFTGEHKEGEETKKIRYQTFKKGLFDAIRDAKNKPNVEVDYDYEEKMAGEDIFKNYKVSALYIDGKEVAGKRAYSGGGGRSPEDRVSIESQVAVKAIIELRIADKIDDNNVAYKKALDWCLKRLAPPIVAKPQPKASVKEQLKEVGAVEEKPAFDFKWWKENLEATNYTEWLPETLKMLHIKLNKDYVTTLKGMDESQLGLIRNEIAQRLKSKGDN